MRPITSSNTLPTAPDDILALWAELKRLEQLVVFAEENGDFPMVAAHEDLIKQLKAAIAAAKKNPPVGGYGAATPNRSAEVRFVAPDGDPVYETPDDGGYVEGRCYAERWWAPSPPPTTFSRDFVWYPGVTLADEDDDRSAFAADDYDSDRIVTAYATRWGVPTEQRDKDGAPCWSVTTEESLSDWLHTWRLRGCPPVPCLAEHRGDPLGEIVAADFDDVGLLVTAVLYETRAADETLSRMHSGDLTAFSLHLDVGWTDDLGRGDHGWPVYEVRRCELVEAGPTRRPNDPGALVLSAGGIDLSRIPRDWTPRDAEELEAVRRILNLPTDPEVISREARLLGYQREREAHDPVREVRGFAAAVANFRRQSWIFYEEYRRAGMRGDGMSRALEAARDAKALDDELRDLCCSDNRIRQRALEAAGCGPEWSPLSFLGR